MRYSPFVFLISWGSCQAVPNCFAFSRKPYSRFDITNSAIPIDQLIPAARSWTYDAWEDQILPLSPTSLKFVLCAVTKREKTWHNNKIHSRLAALI
jgi:hypothetical protein